MPLASAILAAAAISAGVLAVPAPASAAAAGVGETPATLPLALVRSFEIPAGDPAASRLRDWSWTYDSAVSAAALAVSGDKAGAARLLDQLTALQHADGSIDLAFNTVTGESAPILRSGNIAWVGLAAAAYDQAFASSRYLDTERRAADYLLSMMTPTGLVKGGPDVSWMSSEHNFEAYVFMSRLGSELTLAGDLTAASRYKSAARTLAAAIKANLVASDASGAHILQGVDDDTRALDVQALGAAFLQATGQPTLAAKVLTYANSAFAVAGRSVVLSSDLATFNMTYSAAGPFSGYKPYAGWASPDVMWAEGSGWMRMATAALGRSTTTIDANIARWDKIATPAGTALQADRTDQNDNYGTDYHVWPAAAPAAWVTLSKRAPGFFSAAPSLG